MNAAPSSTGGPGGRGQALPCRQPTALLQRLPGRPLAPIQCAEVLLSSPRWGVQRSAGLAVVDRVRVFNECSTHLGATQTASRYSPYNLPKAGTAGLLGLSRPASPGGPFGLCGLFCSGLFRFRFRSGFFLRCRCRSNRFNVRRFDRLLFRIERTYEASDCVL